MPVAVQPTAVVSAPVPEAVVEAPPLPTLEDVAALTHDSDYSRFVKAGVAPNVKNAAMKKLFSDPHFNVMDGLDTYIDDYGLPDPIPESMLRRMTQSKFLRLFESDAEPAPDGEAIAAADSQAGATPPEASPDGAAAPALPQSAATAPEFAPPETRPDEDIALRLQPDNAAAAAGAGPHRASPRP